MKGKISRKRREKKERLFMKDKYNGGGIMKIGISGTHGTGKTTFLYKKAYELKIKYPEKTLKLLTEVVRECPLQFFSNENKSSIDAQLWIFGNQIKRELESQNHDIILMDRTIFDVIAYTMEVDKAVAFNMLLLSDNLYYDKIYFLRPDKNYCVKDGERSTNEELRTNVDNNLKVLLNNRLNIGKLVL